MRPSLLFAAALFAAAVVVASPTWADDKKVDDDKTFTIKAPPILAKGKSVKVNEKVTIKEASKLGDLNLKKQKEQLHVYVEKTIDADDKATTRKKFSRAYESAKEIEGDESTKLPYHGRTIIAESSDGKWELTAEGKPALDSDDLKELSERINRSEKAQDALYPKKAVAVGGKWTMDSKEVAKLLDSPIVKIDADSIKGEGKLVKAYKKGDVQWGTLEYVITFESTVLQFKGLKGEVNATIDQPLDGSSQASKAVSKVKLSGKGEVEFNCMKVNYDIAVEQASEAEVTDVK